MLNNSSIYTFIGNIFYIGAGGFIGANLRYVVGLASKSLFGPYFPVGTWIVNIVGSFALGYLHSFFLQRSDVSLQTQFFLTTGLLGAVTTFSTFNLESYLLFQNGEIKKALLNTLGSVFLGLLALAIGYMVATRR